MVAEIKPKPTISFAGLFDSPAHQCYRVKDGSLAELHIAAGDYVVVNPARKARHGDVVIRRLAGNEATVERYDPGAKAVEGIVVGVIRQIGELL